MSAARSSTQASIDSSAASGSTPPSLPPGGLAPGADSARLPDLAGRLRDGEQVKVPFVKGAGGGVAGSKVGINSATAEELASVPGFTPELAQAVVDYRDRFGPIGSLTELTSVLGMSRSDYLVARKLLTLG